MNNIPSIFNDVIGPVMRGPSSSHCAATVRLGNLARDLMSGDFDEVLIEFDKNGSLATTHESQGSDMGLFAGLLGWEATHENLVNSERIFKKKCRSVIFNIDDYRDPHPNTYRLFMRNRFKQHHLIALSTGGGLIEIITLDGYDVSIKGDYYETIVVIDKKHRESINSVTRLIEHEYCLTEDGKNKIQVNIKSRTELSKDDLNLLNEKFPGSDIITLKPVLPVLSSKNVKIPFLTAAELLNYNKNKKLSLWELAVLYESARGSLTDEQVLAKMDEITQILKDAIKIGIEGTNYDDRILDGQAVKFKEADAKSKLIGGGLVNRIILYVTALMDMKSSMNVIVAAPTAGACGALPGACFAAAEELNLTGDDISKALMAAGLIGVFIAHRATFAAELGGCQAECGSASGMAAAGLVTLYGGTAEQALSAASMALQNILGMVCDPVANRVEVPCLGKNVMAATNALTCANMALAGFAEVIPLDEVIETMDKVGKSLPHELRCTALGGLSVTKTSKRIEQKLKEKK